MEGASLTTRCVQGPPRAARRSEWLRSALLHHHHRPDSGVQNEIVVLATGIDQYLQEVFHHLAHPNEEDTVSSEDFCSLCALLGVSRRRRSAEDKEDDDEFKDICSDLPPQLCFKEFHSRLCGYFRAGSTGTGEGRLSVSEDTELVERQIRVRWPRVRRKYVSFDLDQTTKNKELHSSRMTDEVSALRELVEDLRSALQGSDARCLALEVALRREKTRLNPPVATVSSPTSITFAHGKLVPTSRIKGDGTRRIGRRRDIRDPLARELKLIRSSRDGQLNEAIKFNKRLEEEVSWAYQAVRKLQAEESALRRENTLIRRRAEEAREALSLGLQRVQVIQKEAELVPQLQTRITQLEKEVHEYRSSCTCTHNHLDPDPQTGEDISSKSGETCLQRAVEGKDASDEEEDGGGGKERALVEVKKCSGRLHGSSEGSLEVKILTTQQRFDPQHRTHVRADGDSEELCSQKRQTAEQPVSCRNYGELQVQKDNARGDQRERTFLSAVEEKFRDALMLLLQLRNKSVSCLQMDRIVMDVCGKSGDCPTQVLHVADSLCLHLSSNDTVREQRRVLGHQTGTLLISC